MPRIKWVYRIKNPDGSIQEAPSAIIAAHRIKKRYPAEFQGIDDPGPYAQLYETDICILQRRFQDSRKISRT